MKVNVAEGDRVEEGQILAELDAKQEAIDVRRFEKVLESRQFDNTAGQSLLKRAMISKEEALDRQLEYEIASLQLEAAKALLEKAQIRSPLNGIVTTRLKDPGESTTESEPMFEVVDVSQVFAQIYLPRNHGSSLTPGEQVEVLIHGDDGEAWSAPGEVQFVSPVIDSASGLRRCKILIANRDDKIDAGMRASVVLSPKP